MNQNEAMLIQEENHKQNHSLRKHWKNNQMQTKKEIWISSFSSFLLLRENVTKRNSRRKGDNVRKEWRKKKQYLSGKRKKENMIWDKETNHLRQRKHEETSKQSSNDAFCGCLCCFSRGVLVQFWIY